MKENVTIEEKEKGEIIWRRKMLPQRDNEQTNKERKGYSANRLWRAEMSNEKQSEMSW